MSVCRKTSRVYCDVYDLDGCMNAIGQRLEEEVLDPGTRMMLKGAYYTLMIFAYHDHVDTQADFMTVLLNYWNQEHGRNLE